MGQPVKRTKTSSFGTNGRAGHDASKFYGQRLYQDFNIATSKKKAGRENTPEQLDIIHLGDSRDMNTCLTTLST